MSKNNGFTLIELLVVISIIGLLSSVVLAGLNAARAKSRDSRRIQDLNQVRTAMYLYHDDFGHFVSVNSGCGSGGNGNGWFNYSNGTTYPAATSQCLVNGGYTASEIIDPTGARANSTAANTIYNYMKYTCGLASAQRTFLLAKLETLPQSATVTDIVTCCSTCDTAYGMNYVLQID